MSHGVLSRCLLSLSRIPLLVLTVALLATLPENVAAQDCQAGPTCVSPNCVYCHWYGFELQECKWTYGSAQCGCSWFWYIGDNYGVGCMGVGYCYYGDCSGFAAMQGAIAPGCSPWEPSTPAQPFSLDMVQGEARLLTRTSSSVLLGELRFIASRPSAAPRKGA
jgi:hypothetical protein